MNKPEFGVFLALVILVSVFSLSSSHFLRLESWGGILTVSTEIGLIALGVTLLMIAGEFDLSVGSNFAMSGMIFALLTQSVPWLPFNPVSGFVIALLVGSLIGYLNGVITVRTGIPSFITTLGTMLFWRAVVLIITDGFPIASSGENKLLSILGFDIGNGFRASVFLWVFFALLLGFVLKMHPFGNWLMATGGNSEASYSMGVNVSKVKLTCFTLTGFLSALAGIIQFAHLESLSPTAGEQYELRAIAITVVGGTLLAGGVGTIVGTILGTLIMGIMVTGLVQAGVTTYWLRAFIGVILVLAVVVNTRMARRKNLRAA